MAIFNHTPTATAARLAAAILLAATSGAASAHGSGALSHMAAPAAPHVQASRATSGPHPIGATGMATHGTPGIGDIGTTLPTTATLSTLPATVATQCEGEVSATCEATAESRTTVSNGDPNPIWNAPVPTAVPATPPTDPIAEPQDSTTQNFEQSGGASGVVITAGGGPTLADCMSLWEPAVHMSRPLWKDVCVRTMNGIDEPQVALGWVDPAHGTHGKHEHATRVTHGGNETSGLTQSPRS